MHDLFFMEVPVMANDDRPTVRPPGGPRTSGIQPPADAKFVVQLYYPHNIALARSVIGHLHKRVEDTFRRTDLGRKDRAYAGLALDTAAYEKLNEHIRGVVVNALIVGTDEFCDVEALFQEIKRFYATGTPIIVHATAPAEMDLASFLEYGALGAFAGYNFSEVDSLLDAVAHDKLKPHELVIDQD